jgi:hypothetical protein
MIYLYGYLGAGALFLVLALGLKRLAGKSELELLLDSLAVDSPKREKLGYRIQVDILAPVLTVLVVVVLWPVGLFMKAKDLLIRASDGDTTNYYDPDREFTVQHADLQQCLSIAEIEECAYITDPLNAVPPLPFGHLYSAWKALVDGIGPDDTVWSFSTLWPYCGRQELRKGYVVVRGDVVGAYFLTSRCFTD